MRRLRDVGMLITYVQLIDCFEVEKCMCGYVTICCIGNSQITSSVVCVVSVVVEGYFCMSGC